MDSDAAITSTARRLAITVRGVVQGVGFRPFVYRQALGQGLSGWVRNEADRVEIEVQGPCERVARFVQLLRSESPPQARLDTVEVRELACCDGQAEGFAIRSSTGQAAPRPTVPADLATCPECQAEIRDPNQRRYGYPFTNCTNCGPRWSIVAGVPYDRPRTSMAAFRMCPECQAEYDDPADRRFHAQPIACPRCGPSVELLDRAGRTRASGGEALEQVAVAILAGQIVALKGLGGFQLLCDATSDAAVTALRQRKRRPDKPLALMFASAAGVRDACELSAAEEEAIASHRAPILLARRRSEPRGVPIAPSVAPDNPYLGVMLPYTPLHHLLMSRIDRPVVCTSGNLSEEPMAVENAEAMSRLGPIADLFLVHDRSIVRPVDDSVIQFTPEGPQVLRRSRGYAPLPLTLAEDGPVVLALGGHLKNTVALALGRQAILSSHVGDLDNLLSVEVHRQAAGDLVDFFQVRPEAVACDLHPDYASTRTAESLAGQWRVPLLRVQHHEAHVAAAMAERALAGPVLGLSWDGTGYGTDGTVWGGEALLCDAGQFTRAAHLRVFPLPGGDRAAREPRRSALGVLYSIDPDLAREQAAAWFSPEESKVLLALLPSGRQVPRTSSMGRLFDAVAALCGLPAAITFEGQAAMRLQFAADEACEEAYPLPLSDGTPAVADWEPLVRSVLADRERGEPIGRISARFHNALGELALAIAGRAGLGNVVLSGGCFQNVLLADRVARRLRGAGFQVYQHGCVPPGDGGIALGQVYVARHQLRAQQA